MNQDIAKNHSGRSGSFPILALTALLLIALLLAATGCTTFESEVAKVIPPGDYDSITGTVTGKFSATQFTAEHVTILPTGQMVGGHVHVRHSNAYVPLIEIDVQAAKPANVVPPTLPVPDPVK